MKIFLDSRKSLHANAAAYFVKSKQAAEKISKIKSAIAEVESKVYSLSQKQAGEGRKARESITIKVPFPKKEWFEKFHFFFTSGGRLCVAGGDAKQNELLVAKHFEKVDLFFHADVQGAAATILKAGAAGSAFSDQDLRETAQFAACFSRAWKAGFSSVDVYAVGREQVSKQAQAGEFVGKGGFVIRGERKWFKNTELKLLVVKTSAKENEPAVQKPIVLPAVFAGPIEKKNFAEISPGKEKPVLAREIAAKLGLGKQEVEELMRLLP